MALKVYDGFEKYKVQADMQARQGVLEWSDISGGPVSFVTGRGGFGYAVSLPGTSGGYTWIGGSYNANFSAANTAVAAQLEPLNGQYLDIMLMDYSTPAPGGSPNGSSGAAQITFRCSIASGLIQVYRGDPVVAGATLLAQTPPNAFSPYIWNKLETLATISTSGSFNLQVNGTSVVSASGVNTSSTGNAWYNGVRYRIGFVQESGSALLLDDFNLNDTTTGSGTYALNGFIGDCATRTLFTTANNSVSWTPLTSSNWVEVGEMQFDRDTSYNFATTVGNADTFTFGSLASTVAAVFGVQVTGAYRKQDAGSQTIKQRVISNGTTQDGSVWPLSLDWSYVTDLLVLDPHTGASWTVAAVNAIDAGYVLNS